MARISKSNMEREKAEILSHLKNDIRKANLRLTLLEKNYGKDSWASAIYKERLESAKVQALTLSGKAKADSSMSLMQLRAIDKATQSFLNSKTSKLSDIRKIRSQTIKEFRERFADSDDFKIKKISTEDAEKLYSIFEDRDTRKFAEKHGGSPVLQLLADNMKKGSTRKEFFADVYANLVDEGSIDVQTKKALNKIYRNIIK